MQCNCGHALIIHEDVRDPKTGKVIERYAGPCMATMPKGEGSDGKMRTKSGYCPCPAGKLAIEL